MSSLRQKGSQNIYVKKRSKNKQIQLVQNQAEKNLQPLQQPTHR